MIMIMIIIITINYYEKYRYLNVANTWRKKHDYERLVYKWELFDRLFVCYMNACMFFWAKFRKNARESERARERERRRGRVLGAEWNGWDNCTAL